MRRSSARAGPYRTWVQASRSAEVHHRARTAARCWQDWPSVELPTLTDGIVTLRPKRPEDADAITAACQDPEIPRWTLVPSPYTREHAVEWIAQQDLRSASLLAVDADGTLLGSFSVM